MSGEKIAEGEIRREASRVLRKLMPPGAKLEIHARMHSWRWKGPAPVASTSVFHSRSSVKNADRELVSSRYLGGAAQAFNGGLLALPSNIGRYDRDVFSWVPELGVTIGYQCTDHWKLFVGYNVLYWSSVVRPGEQIDRTVNANQLPPPVGGGPNRPLFTFNANDFAAISC